MSLTRLRLISKTARLHPNCASKSRFINTSLLKLRPINRTIKFTQISQNLPNYNHSQRSITTGDKQDFSANCLLSYFSFYKYVKIPHNELELIRRSLLKSWGEELGVEGRIYISDEGINAQVTVPVDNYKQFEQKLRSHPYFGDAPIYTSTIIETPNTPTAKQSILDQTQTEEQSNGKPFETLHVRIRPLVRDIPNSEFEGLNAVTMDNNGKSVPPDQWHKMVLEMQQQQQQQQASAPKTVMIDVRAFHESRVGTFEGAERLQVERHYETFEDLERIFREKNVQKDDTLMLYCTGGIRCERVGAYLAQRKGFQNIMRLEGGINHYVAYAKANNLESQFKGKNYVFDGRLANDSLRATDDILTNCDICGDPADTYYNCENPVCNILYIECKNCNSKRHHHVCSGECNKFQQLSEPIRYQIQLRYEKTVPKSVRARSTIGVGERFNFQKAYQLLASEPIQSDNTASTPTNPQTSITEKEKPKKIKIQSKLVSEDIDRYSSEHSSPEPPAIVQVSQTTMEKLPSGVQMMSGSVQGQFLQMLVRLSNAKHVLELGTLVGYSALYMAMALPKDGILITCENSKKSVEIARENLQHHPAGEKISIYEGSAMETLQGLAKKEQSFDLIFVDADKSNYLNYFDFILDSGLLKKPNGILVVDNVLWKGEVVSDPETMSNRAKRMVEFNKHVAEDPRVEKVLLPVRDGLYLIMHKSQNE